MTNETATQSELIFGECFLEVRAGSIVREPRVAVIELIANACDPGATEVEVIEYALSRTASPALIAEYQTQLPDRALPLRKLHEFYELAQSPTVTEVPKRKRRKPAR